MKNLKSLWLTLIILALAGGAIYLFIVSRPRPYSVLVPKSSPPGTVVSLFKDLPPGFPKEVVLETTAPIRSGTVAMTDKSTQFSVAYLSGAKLNDLMVSYENSFKGLGWSIVSKSLTKVGVLQTAKGDQTIVLTIVSLSDKETMLTFQYEK